MRNIVLLALVGLALSNSWEYAGASDLADRVRLNCIEMVFDKTIGKNPQQVLRAGCSSKSGTNLAYKLALNFYKDGVNNGVCGQFLPKMEGAIDAEAVFKMSNTVSTSIRAGIDECRAVVRKSHEKTMSGLTECINSEYVSELLDVAKSCGEGVYMLFSSLDYAEIYKELCTIKKKDKVLCSKLAEQAHINYLKKIKSNMNK